jgi:hypothetical protein
VPIVANGKVYAGTRTLGGEAEGEEGSRGYLVCYGSR